MKFFTYITLIALMICGNPLLAMKEQEGVETEQEKKAVETLKKLRKKQPEFGAGIKIFGSDENPISLELEGVLKTSGEICWYPTEAALTNLFNTYSPLKEYLPNMPKAMVEKNREEGGSMTGALFVAYRDKNQSIEGTAVKGKPLFFLKISNSQEIPTKLDALQKGPVGRFNREAFSNPELPIIVLQEMFFICRGKNSKNYTIEVMHVAHGKQVSSIIKSAPDTTIKNCAEKVGKALGLFHIYFMNYHNSNDPAEWTTMIHGDFNARNIFFYEKSGRVYFIDNADMRESYRIKNDFVFFPDEARDPFIKGYLSAYPLDKREFMTAYLKKQGLIAEKKPMQELEETIQQKKEIKADSSLTSNEKEIQLNLLRARERELKKQCEKQDGTCSVQ
jgi:hypothetical protein